MRAPKYSSAAVTGVKLKRQREKAQVHGDGNGHEQIREHVHLDAKTAS